MKRMVLFVILAILPLSSFAQDKLAILQALADSDNANAQFELAEHYAAGYGIEQNDQQAFYWYKKAAEQTHLAAMFSLATAYDLGEGVEQNYQQAIKWYKKAAMYGEASAAYNMGVLYDEGLGVRKDAIQANTWLRVADLMQHELADQVLQQTSSMLSPQVRQDIEAKAQAIYQQVQSNIEKEAKK